MTVGESSFRIEILYFIIETMDKVQKYSPARYNALPSETFELQ
jgi:hypothetical protein